MSKLAINAISKNLMIAKVFSKNIFELSLYHQLFSFRVVFILIPLLNNCFAKKQSYKKNAVKPISSVVLK